MQYEEIKIPREQAYARLNFYLKKKKTYLVLITIYSKKDYFLIEKKNCLAIGC